MNKNGMKRKSLFSEYASRGLDTEDAFFYFRLRERRDNQTRSIVCTKSIIFFLARVSVFSCSVLIRQQYTHTQFQCIAIFANLPLLC